MARVLAISSHVARGYVGLSAIVPALQRLGHEVVAMPTMILSHHPGHPHAAGERIAPDVLRRMVDGLERNDWLADVDAILTGYLPSAEHVRVAAEIVARVRSASQRAAYLCDTVMGDWPRGLYIATDAADALRDVLVPVADIVKGNAFEIGYLSGVQIAGAGDVAVAAASIGRAALLATSIPHEAGLANVLVRHEADLRSISVAEHRGVPKGTGDVLSGLLIGYALRAGPRRLDAAARAAVRATEIIVERSLGCPEMALVEALPLIDQIAV